MGAAGGIAVGVDAFAPERLVAPPHRRAFGLLCQDTAPLEALLLRAPEQVDVAHVGCMLGEHFALRRD
jgi:hypothetical protein